MNIAVKLDVAHVLDSNFGFALSMAPCLITRASEKASPLFEPVDVLGI